MKIIVTAGYVLEHGDWDKFCDIVGLSVYAINEGMDKNREFSLTLKQAVQLGLLTEWVINNIERELYNGQEENDLEDYDPSG